MYQLYIFSMFNIIIIYGYNNKVITINITNKLKLIISN